MRIRATALLLLFAIPAPVCAMPRDTTNFVLPWARTPKSWEVDLAPADEPGLRLEMSGRVLGQRDSLPDPFLRPAMSHGPPSDDEHPVPGVRVYAYHADARGYYSLPGEGRFGERIAGVLRTSRNGEYRLRTILPGQYAGQPHVHFEIWGPKLARRVVSVNLHASPGASVPGWKKEINPGLAGSGTRTSPWTPPGSITPSSISTSIARILRTRRSIRCGASRTCRAHQPRPRGDSPAQVSASARKLTGLPVATASIRVGPRSPWLTTWRSFP